MKFTNAVVAGALASMALFAGTGQAIAQAYRFTALPAANGYLNAEPTAINDFGQVVGISFNTNLESSQATIWNNGTPSALGYAGGGISQAYGIDNGGQVVGGVNVSTTGNDWHAVVWSGSTTRDLGPGMAFAINKSGQVAGTNERQQAVIWNGGTVTQLGSGPDQTGQ
ncbi:MAG: hypothetical protein IPL72_18805 [Sulfuritalea sp.]|nr:hypothetical protein [Sulfuritalea sp.]